MPERPQFDARYEPGRSSDGKFAKGNQLAKGNAGGFNGNLAAIRCAWYDCQKPEDMVAVQEELLALIKTCPNHDVKLKAIVYYCDRMLGKPTERVEMDVNGDQKPNVALNLNADQIAILNAAAGILTGDAATPIPLPTVVPLELPGPTKIVAERTQELE